SGVALAASGRLSRCGARRLALHVLAQAERAHVGPHLVDVVQAVLLFPRLARGAPALGQRLVVGPDGVLLFVVHDHLEDRVFVVPAHPRPPEPAAGGAWLAQLPAERATLGWRSTP